MRVAAPESHKYMIVVRDLHSKGSEVSCTSSVTSSTVTKTFKELLARWGLSEAVTTDSGPQFTSFEFTEFLRSQGIKHHLTALYNLEANMKKVASDNVVRGANTHISVRHLPVVLACKFLPCIKLSCHWFQLFSFSFRLVRSFIGVSSLVL